MCTGVAVDRYIHSLARMNTVSLCKYIQCFLFLQRKAAAILRQSQSESSEHKRKRLLDRVEQCRDVKEKNEEENGDGVYTISFFSY